MKKNLIFLSVALVHSVAFANLHPTVPKGFEGKTLKRVLKGEIVTTTLKDSAYEFHQTARAYFNKVSTDAYIRLGANHPKYISMFPEIRDARTLTANKTKTLYTYAVDLVISAGFLSYQVNDLRGRQNVTWAKSPTEPAVIANSITNYKQKIHFLNQTTRLYPYKGGIMVEEELHGLAHKDVSQASLVKKYLKAFFSRYVETFREELDGDY